MRIARLLTPVLVVGALLLAACDNDDVLTRAEFIEEGDEICAELDERFAEIGATRAALTEIHPERTDDLLLALSSTIDEGVEDFRQLQPPPDGRVVKGEISLRLREAEEALRRAARAVLDSRPPGAHSEGFGTGAGDLDELAEGQEPGDPDGAADRYGENIRIVFALFDALHEEAADYGFDACAEDWIAA